MKIFHEVQRLISLFLFLSLLLQSCRAAVKLKHEQEVSQAQDQALFIAALGIKSGMSGDDHIDHVACQEAIKAQHLAIIKKLLSAGYEAAIADTLSFIPLPLTGAKDYLALVNLLVGSCAHHPNICAENGVSLLHWAAYRGQLAIVNFLLGKRANVNSTDQDGYTPLQLAAEKGDVAIASLLLKKGASPNIFSAIGRTPLHWAVYHGQLALVNLLLAKGAELNLSEGEALPPLNLAVKRGHTEIVRVLLAKGANPNTVTAAGYTALHWAAVQGHVEISKLLLEKGAELHAIDADAFTPVDLAIERGHVEVLRLFLDKGIKVEDPARGFSLLHWPIYDAQLEIVNLLLEKGADPNTADQDGVTPLYLAMDQGHVAIIKVLLAKGADPNRPAADKSTPLHDKSTPLHWAAYDGNLEIVNLLLAAGADPNIVDAKKCTPLHVAADEGHMPIMLRLLLCPVDINAQNEHGETFLHHLVTDASLMPKEALYRFLEAMKHIEKNQNGLLGDLAKVMQDYCPALTNEDGKSILAMVIDYSQGVDLTLKNQHAESILAIIEQLLGEATPSQEQEEEVVKTLDRYQKLGGWVHSRIQNKRKVSTSAQAVPASKKHRTG